MSAVVLWILTGTRRSLDVFVGMSVVSLLSDLRTKSECVRTTMVDMVLFTVPSTCEN